MKRKNQPACGQGIAIAMAAVAPREKFTDGVRYVNVKQGKNAFNRIGKEQRG